MKRLYLSLGSFLVLLALPAFAQSRFSVAITGAPAVSHTNTRLIAIIPGPSSQLEPLVLTNYSTPSAFVMGAMVHYTFTPKWSASTGLWYDRSGRNYHFPFAPGGVPARLIQQDLQVPLFLNFRSSKKRLSPYFTVGSVANIHSSTLYRVEPNSGLSSVRLAFKNPVNFQATVGAGISYQFNPHLSLIAQPMLLWRFKPKGNYEQYVSYQVNGQIQLMYSL